MSVRQINEKTGVCFFRVERETPLLDFLQSVDLTPLPAVSRPQLEDSLFFGGVYVDGQRQRQDKVVMRDQVIRLHTRRKRFLKNEPLRERIVFENAGLLVLDKPAGLPTHPTLDNYVENAKFQLEIELGHPVLTTHRLDVETQGLLVFAKTLPMQQAINKVFSKRQVKKTYRALTEVPLPLGELKHYMDPTSRPPKSLSSEAHEGWCQCLLIVESSEAQGDFYLNTIRLLTGRTHQIRAQLAELGAPILGDGLYGSERLYGEGIGLECFQLEMLVNSQTFAFERQKFRLMPLRS